MAITANPHTRNRQINKEIQYRESKIKYNERWIDYLNEVLQHSKDNNLEVFRTNNFIELRNKRIEMHKELLKNLKEELIRLNSSQNEGEK